MLSKLFFLLKYIITLSVFSIVFLDSTPKVLGQVSSLAEQEHSETNQASTDKKVSQVIVETTPVFDPLVGQTSRDAADLLLPIEGVIPSDLEDNTLPNLENEKPDVTIPSIQELEPTEDLEIDTNYQIQPIVVPDEKVPPILTITPLNDVSINHLTELLINSRLVIRDSHSANIYIDAVAEIDSQVTQSLTKDNVFRSDFQGTYSQLRTLNEQREVKFTIAEPRTLIGMELQLSFTGSCEVLGISSPSPDSQCAFIPPLITDRDSIDPDFLVPTRIEQLGTIGDVISPETLAILKLPGFQNRGVNGEAVGIDFYLPNIGALPSGNGETEITREEEIDTTYAVGLYGVRQIVETNSEKAVLGRTIRGSSIILSDDNLGRNVVVLGLAAFLPDVQPNLDGSEEPANTDVNRNLFFAANNTRLPGNSFAVYHAGIGEARHSQRSMNTTEEATAQDSPPGTFNGIWIGLSPVIERTLSRSFRFVPTGSEQVLVEAGGEGGADNSISFVSSTNDFTINSTDLIDNFYIQAYLSVFARESNQVTTSLLAEDTDYFPHISFTGNKTWSDQVLRYYTGVIATDDPKSYAGGDYTLDIDNWRLNLGAIGYINPDKEYFSNVNGNLSKRINLSPTSNLLLSTSFRYAWDRDEEIILDDPVDNFVGIGANFSFDNFSFGITQLFDLLPDSVGNQLQANASVRIGEKLRLIGYFLPERNIDNFGVTAQYQLSEEDGNYLLQLRWSRSIFDFGEDALGNDLETTNDTLTFLVKTSIF